VVRCIPVEIAQAGLSQLVRAQRAYWVTLGMTGPPWPVITDLLETEIMNSPRQSPLRGEFTTHSAFC
jgi:hypothetical protein